MNQELQALEAHLASGRFKAGVARGRWQLVAVSWPYAFVKVFDRHGRGICVRFDCTGYPGRPPQGTPWDYETQQQLPAHLWPRGGRVSQVFNPGWQCGAALYVLLEQAKERKLALNAVDLRFGNRLSFN